MQRNKYLEDLGIPIKHYGTNFVRDDDERQSLWKEQREVCGFDSRECWNLDKTFVEWLYSHLMMYKEESIVNMNFHKIVFQEREYTQKESIDFILEKLKVILGDIDNNEAWEGITDAIHMWAKIINLMWW